MSDRPAPFEDPEFLAALSAVDRVEEAPPPGLPILPQPGTSGRRRLLDLFPPQDDSGAPDSEAPPGAADDFLSLPIGLPGAFEPTRNVRPGSVAPARPPASAAATFYGLDESAFGPTTDAKFLYQSDAYGRAAQQIVNGIWRRERLAVLTGEEGVGKTMLCRSLTEQLDRRTLVSFVAEPCASTDDLLRTVLVDLGVVSASEAGTGHLARASRVELLGALRDFLQSIAVLQAFAVVIVDAAERLPTDALREIGALVEVSGDEPLLQVLLVGRPELLRTLSSKALRPLADAVTLWCRLEPVAEDEIFGYVMQRLVSAGSRSRVEFQDDALARIYAWSHGVPRTVNQLCDRALQEGADRGAGAIDAPAIDAAAESLDLDPETSPAMTLVRRAAIVLVLVLLVAVGASAAAIVFRADVEALLFEWRNTPAVPAAPAPPAAPPLPPSPSPAG
jgi:general secretion pathway protein A